VVVNHPAEMAATNLRAISNSASAMPGITTARLMILACEVQIKLFIMPRPAPSKPTKGPMALMVTRNPYPPMNRVGFQFIQRRITKFNHACIN